MTGAVTQSICRNRDIAPTTLLRDPGDAIENMRVLIDMAYERALKPNDDPIHFLVINAFFPNSIELGGLPVRG
ncbi:hypothetical protein [uncultured Roseobacter sp.]|uniref:hypothetical protein n=1 Tax=uncultured Roseobacter sp. TaxID=114847 RepID=UPI00261FA056|nr:hypothetical protein [uncultured Roseobacter sp.]